METMEMTTAAAADGKPGYKLTKLGWIPEEWTITKWSDVTSQVTVGIASAATHAYRSSGVMFLRNMNIKEGYLDTKDLLFIDENFEYTFRNKRLKTGDILTTRTGTNFPGISAVITEEFAGSQSFTTLISRPKPEIVNSDYLCYLINSELGKEYVNSGRVGGGQKNINASILLRFTFPLPPKEVQEAIVVFLKEWEKYETGIAQLIESKSQFKRGLMQQLLTGQRRFPEFQGQPWREFRLGEVFKDFSQLNRNNEDLPILSCSKVYGIVLQETLFGRRIASEDIRRYKVVTGGDLVYDPMLLWDASLGFVASVPRGVISPAYVTLRYTGDPETKALLEQALYSEELRFQYKLISRGTNVRRQKAPAEDFLKIKLSLPTSSVERGKIAAVFTACDQEIELLQAQLRQWQQQKKGLMQQLLTGQLRVPHA